MTERLTGTAARLAETLLGPPQFTRIEIAAAAGIEVAHARRLWQGLGFPPVADDARVFSRADGEVLVAVRALLDERGTPEALTVQQARVIGQALARVADAQVTATLDNALAHRGGASADGEALAAALQAIEAQLPTFEGFVRHAWRRHMVAAVLRLAAAPAAGDRVCVIGFADLAGFTPLSSSLDSAELAAAVDRFEAVAYEHILSGGGRVVKTIGDEVMFAADEPAAGAAIALALAEAYTRDPDLPEARLGLAFGPVVAWEGDLFGPTVNLASRLVNFARPGTVLLAENFGAALQDLPAFVLRHLRPVKLKGIGAVRAWVLRRGAADPPAAADAR